MILSRAGGIQNYESITYSTKILNHKKAAKGEI